VYEANITHNLTKMARAAYLYNAMWRPDEIGAIMPKLLIPALKKGIRLLRNNKEHMLEYNPKNGWGDYEILLSTAVDYFKACCQYPYEKIEISR
jgi:hypothetical protein